MRVLVLAGSAAALAGCGQKGPLAFPQEPAAANRATLAETLKFRVTGDPQQKKAAPGTTVAPAASATPPAAPATPPMTEQSYDLQMVPESTMPPVTAPNNAP